MAGQLDTLIEAIFFFFLGHLPFAKRKKQNKEQWKIEKKPSNWINSFFQFGPSAYTMCVLDKVKYNVVHSSFLPCPSWPDCSQFLSAQYLPFCWPLQLHYYPLLSISSPILGFFFLFFVVVCSRNVGHERPVDIQKGCLYNYGWLSLLFNILRTWTCEFLFAFLSCFVFAV